MKLSITRQMLISRWNMSNHMLGKGEKKNKKTDQ